MNDLSMLILLILSGVVLGILFFSAIGASIYDIYQAKNRAYYAKHKNSRKLRRRPLISIVIMTRNQGKTIPRCLHTIVTSSYRKYEVIVIDNASTDTTALAARDFITQHPKKPIRLIVKRKYENQDCAINTAVKRYAKGELVMTIDGDSFLAEDALRTISRYFLLDERLAALALNVRIMPRSSILSLLQQYDNLVNFRLKKLSSIVRAQHFIDRSGAVYRRDVYTKISGLKRLLYSGDKHISLSMAGLDNKKYRLAYASDAVVYAEPVNHYTQLFKQQYTQKLGTFQILLIHRKMLLSNARGTSRLFAWVYLPFSFISVLLLITQPVIYSYFIYLAFASASPLLFVVGWVGLVTMLTFTVWGDDQFSFMQKLQMSFYLPIMYLSFYIMSLIHVGVQLNCLLNVSKIFRVKSSMRTTTLRRKLTHQY